MDLLIFSISFVSIIFFLLLNLVMQKKENLVNFLIWLIYSSISSFIKWKLRPLMKTFLLYWCGHLVLWIFSNYCFLTVSREFWYVVFLFLFSSKHLLIFSLIFLWPIEFLEVFLLVFIEFSMCVNFQIFFGYCGQKA